ncbi:hypothetical protein TRFO_24468 [Tritrichomonas foetus]|uniref:Initiator binding domain-containing protein n=1 Tax=Tritrichomonas foetus TaxID=1144522 RepID=A0A1J4KD63_9EUKA|nr:hypothetical protein TRFO_24468 [Tritrichomonas foetus]|eukprot:OHT07381.1 hypothetical protein TRFO_24468 [Tritrichomonas foetus]
MLFPVFQKLYFCHSESKRKSFLMNEHCTAELPQFWEFLNKNDKKQYIYMRKTLSSKVCKNHRNHSRQTFVQIVNTIKTFSIRNNADDWKRCLVCGIFWLPNNEIAVNSKQLCLLLSKCKSSINGSFQSIHYIAATNSFEKVKTLVETLPFSKTSLIELRQWTVRQLDTGQPHYIRIQKDKKDDSITHFFSQASFADYNISDNDDIDNEILFDNMDLDFKDESIL